ncbi:diguanylate cyclase domain-containing protein [Dactylosporangium sp. CA-233914]|uniref:diguanylate cyclase domain-containing protein n=1 Tax=Dactylosporangium sp. CA-233914 TaxID=3239934 RepID=UPI003D8C4B7F
MRGSTEAAPEGRRRILNALVVAVVLLVGGGLTAVATALVHHGEGRYSGQLMDRYADDAVTAVTNEVGNYQHALADLAVALGAQDRITATGFAALTSGLTRERLPAAAGVGFVAPAHDAGVAALQADWRERGAASLTLVPATPADGADAEHAFVVLNRNFDGQDSAPGRDLSQAAEPAQALRTARETAAFTISRSYVLLRDRGRPAAQQQRSVMLVQPVFGIAGGGRDPRQFRGWITIGVRGGDFMNDTLRAEARDAVQLTLTERDGRIQRVIASAAAGPPGTAGPELDRDRMLAIGQRTWQLALTPTDRLLSAGDRRMTALTLIGGVVVTGLLAVLVGTLAGARDRALGQVAAATVALREDIARRVATEDRLRRREAELRHLALHDPLTALANRTLFYERVEHAFDTHQRSGLTFAVLFLDLDGFKPVNDRFGHNAGDAVLRQVAERLRHGVRSADTVARLGGDEFAVLAEQLTDPGDARAAAERVIAAVNEPNEPSPDLPPGAAGVRVGASVGVALSTDAVDADDILRQADAAMYAAKTGGKGRYMISGA